MRLTTALFTIGAAVIAGGSLGLVGASIPGPDHLEYLLTSNDVDALVLGGTGTPTPGAGVVRGELLNYLQSPDSAGGEFGLFGSPPVNAVAFTTPENPTDSSYLQGDAAVVDKLLQTDSAGQLNSTDPLYLFGYSQSSTILTAVDSHLNDPEWIEYVLKNGGYDGDIAKYSSEIASMGSIAPDLRLVLVGDPAAAPDNGPHGFDNSTNPDSFSWLIHDDTGYGGEIPASGTVVTDGSGVAGQPDADPTNGYGMAGQDTNLDLSPTTVYTVNGDNWAQALLSNGNLVTQTDMEHTLYQGMSASDFTFSDHVGNVDYYTADLNFFQELGYLFNGFWLSIFG